MMHRINKNQSIGNTVYFLFIFRTEYESLPVFQSSQLVIRHVRVSYLSRLKITFSEILLGSAAIYVIQLY